MTLLTYPTELFKVGGDLNPIYGSSLWLFYVDFSFVEVVLIFLFNFHKKHIF